jgi:hypothetical protein
MARRLSPDNKSAGWLKGHSHAEFAAASWRIRKVLAAKATRGIHRYWEELKEHFVRNFRSTAKRPASIEELRSCTQKAGEPIRAYI